MTDLAHIADAEGEALPPAEVSAVLVAAAVVDVGRDARGGPVKALSIKQPWASLIALGIKTIETRSWQTPHRGELAIHASAGLPPTAVIPRGRSMLGDVEVVREAGQIRIHLPGRTSWPYLVPRGVIVATATLADCLQVDGATLPRLDYHPPFPPIRDGLVHVHHKGQRLITPQLAYGDFTPGRWGWLLTDVAPIKQRQPEAKGRLGLWEWSP